MIARSNPHLVPPTPIRPLPPPTIQRSPRAGFFPEKTPLYRIVLACTVAMPHPRPEARPAGR